MNSLMKAAVFVLCMSTGAFGQTKKMAITFDEVPVAPTFVQVDGREVTDGILGALKDFKVTATAFVLGEQIATSADLIGDWLNGGHTLGTMTWSNQDFHDVGVGEFMRQVKQGQQALEPVLRQFGQKRRYFRFPFLHYGATSGDRLKARQLLEAANTTIAHVTVKADDYLFNLKLEQMGPRPDSARLEQLMVEYVMHVMDELKRQEDLGMQVAGHSVIQILQLRANRLNGLFCWQVLDAIREEGYKFVTLSEALADQAYTITENYTGNVGVGYLDMVAASRKKK